MPVCLCMSVSVAVSPYLWSLSLSIMSLSSYAFMFLCQCLFVIKGLRDANNLGESRVDCRTLHMDLMCF